MKNDYTPWTKQEADELARLWKKGRTETEIAEVLDRTPNAVRTFAARRELPKRRRGHVKDGLDLPSEARIRPCMCCARDFFSTWKGNRMCAECVAGA